MSYVSVENVTHLPKSAAAVAAAFLVLQPYPYVVANDMHRAPQAKFFQEQETFLAPQKGSFIVVISPSYSQATDVRRATQAKFFQEPETFIQPQRGNVVVTLATYPGVAQSFKTTRVVNVENVSRIHAQKGSLLVLAQTPIITGSADVFVGQDTQGWPLETFEPPKFVQAWRYNPVILNSFSTYNFATDVRRARQSQQAFEPETFLKPWRTSVVTLNTYTSYIPATDVRRAKQALYFQEPETFFRTAPYNDVLILNGSALIVMPNVVGLQITAAIALLSVDGFLNIATGNSLTIGAPGVVASQLPVAGTGVSVNTPITLLAPGLMPNLVGLLLQEALWVLEQTGFVVPANIGYFGTYPVTAVWKAADANHGMVTAQSIPAGLPSGVNQPITLTVNDYPTGVAFPAGGGSIA